jgi:hypothetical protein
MVNKNFCLGMLVLVFGVLVVGSAFGQDKALNGKWRSPESRYGGFENDEFYEYTFLAGDYEIISCVGRERSGRLVLRPLEKGKYTTDDKGVILLRPTHFYFDDYEEWYTKDELIKVLKTEEGASDAEIKEWFEEEGIFVNRSFVYSISSVLGYQVLELYQGREKSTYIKQ